MGFVAIIKERGGAGRRASNYDNFSILALDIYVRKIFPDFVSKAFEILISLIRSGEVLWPQ